MISIISMIPSKSYRIALLLPITLVLSANIAFATADKPKIAEQCFVCHGDDGNSPDNFMIPRIAGQDHIYLETQLYEFRRGIRKNESMTEAVKGLSDQDIDMLVHYFNELPMLGADEIDATKAKIGQEKYAKCVKCHGENGLAPNSGLPRLAGQHANYIIKQLHAFREGTRKGAFSPIMKSMIAEFSDDELKALAAYLSSLGK
ncbi:MAG: c-type cytochrome [Mariprofundales bacterium]